MGAVFFDLDGTLIDRIPSLRAYLPQQYLHYASAERAVGAQNYARRFLELDANGYGHKESLYEALRSEFDLEVGVDELVQDLRSNAFREVVLYPNALDVLIELRRLGYQLGLITNGAEVTQYTKITAGSLAEFLDVILISEVVGLRKPNPAIFRQAAAELAVRPEACLFVGDDPERDVLGAAAAGMRTAWLSYGRSWPVALYPRPLITLRGLGELIEAVTRL